LECWIDFIVNLLSFSLVLALGTVYIVHILSDVGGDILSHYRWIFFHTSRKLLRLDWKDQAMLASAFGQ
jgi:hypothetical protein